MSQKEQQRYHLLKIVIGGKITLNETGSLVRVSCREAKRLKKKLVSEVARALNSELVDKILNLSLTSYTNFNDTHFTENLREEEGVTISRDTVRRLRRTNGIKPKRRRRAKKHFKKRDRSSQEGIMVLWNLWGYHISLIFERGNT